MDWSSSRAIRAFSDSAGDLLTAYRRTLVSTKRIPVVSLVARETVAGAKVADFFKNLALQPPTPLEVGFFFRQLRQELADERADRLALSGTVTTNENRACSGCFSQFFPLSLVVICQVPCAGCRRHPAALAPVLHPALPDAP